MSFPNICFSLEKISVLLKKIAQTIFGPVLGSSLYFYDYSSDIWNIITYFRNCHINFGMFSIIIMVSSYLSTVTYLRFRLKKTLFSALSYPYEHSTTTFKQIMGCFSAIFKGKELPEESDNDKIYAHHVTFMEAITESIMQLCLSCLVLREYGLSNVATERFGQVSGLFTSLLSICLAFAKVRQYQLLIRYHVSIFNLSNLS